MKISLAQMNLAWEDPAANLETMHDLIDRNGCGDVLVLPELWATGFSMNTECHQLVEGLEVFLSKAARDYGIWLIAGIPEWDDDQGGQENRLVLFDCSGNRVGHYAKQKLFTYAKEHHSYASGSRNDTVWNLEGLRVAPSICYELRFPELARQRARQVDLILYAANWPAPRIAHWDVLLPARALENQAYAIGVNRVGEDGNGWQFCGHSACFDPMGERTLFAGSDEGIFHVDVHSETVKQVRENLPFLADMT